jgi:hypothetical protein
MIVIFVHGWSVQHTETYGDLPRWLEAQGRANNAPIQVGNVYLGKYVSFSDAVTVDDIARAFDQAIRDEIGAKLAQGERFACITHSTGGPVVRKWIDLYHRDRLGQCPLSHLIMLAPANHGSALAQLGKSRLWRIKSLLEGAEPGQRVLDWLELGSDQQWELNTAWLGYRCVDSGLFPFVLTGQRIDRKMYDNLNPYTGEAGSDGVVRAAAANMNYKFIRLRQAGDEAGHEEPVASEPSAFGILPGCSHSGEKMGIIRGVTMDNAATHEAARWVLRCLNVATAGEYRTVADELARVTFQTQQDEREDPVETLLGERIFETSRFSMVVFRIVDDRKTQVADYDLYLTAGPDDDPNALPPGFFKDRQRNLRNPGKLTYFLDYDVMEAGFANPKMEGRLGFRLVARPSAGLAYYRELDYWSDLLSVNRVLAPNQTTMVELVLERKVDARVFRISNDLEPSSITDTPLGTPVA